MTVFSLTVYLKAPRNLFDHIILRPTVFGPQNLHQSMLQFSVADPVCTCNWKYKNNKDFHCLFLQKFNVAAQIGNNNFIPLISDWVP